MNCLVYRPQIMTNQFKDVGKWAISSLLFLIISTVGHSAQSPDLGRAMKTHEAKAGTLLVRTNDQDQLRPVPMLATDVTINVTGIVSRSIVTQHFKNPTDQWLEGIYVFPLPDTAAVDTLSMKIGERVIIGKKDVEGYLGKPVYSSDEIFENRPGIVTGLAWTSLGGATLQIEATAVASKRKGFKQTGQLGEGMVESAEIAYSYVMA